MIKADGSLAYFNGDQLSKPAGNNNCGCGYKHYWEGKEYDNLPIKVPIAFEWNEQEVDELVYWFQNESVPSMNSNAYQIAQEMVEEYFPSTFGNERLVQKIVDIIFEYTTDFAGETTETAMATDDDDDDDDDEPKCIPTKIILTGEKSKSLHKEELTASKTERVIQKKIEHGAVVKQKRMSSSSNLVGTQPQPTTPVATTTTTTATKSNVKNIPLSNKNKDIGDSPTREKVKRANSTKKVRIQCVDRGNVTFILKENTSYSELEVFIKESFSIQNEEMIVKYGYPLKELEVQLDDRDKPLTMLKHGDKITVQIKKAPAKVDNDIPAKVAMNIDEEANAGTGGTYKKSIEHLTDSLFSLLDVDLWSWACTQRHLFQVNGMIYKMAFRDLGLLTDDQHLSLPCFPTKIFSYSEREDEIVLCLGKNHIYVQPLTQQELALANEQGLKKQHELLSNHQSTSYHSASPQKPHRSPGEKPFEGRGYSLKDVKVEEENDVNKDGVVRTIRETIDFATFKMETDDDIEPALVPDQEKIDAEEPVSRAETTE